MARWIGKSEDGSQVVLKRLEGCPLVGPAYATPEWMAQNEDLIRTGLVLDVETTGLSHADDVVIELGMRQFQFNKKTGEVLGVGRAYSGFHDPGRPLPVEITALTGITDEMVQGQSIDWAEVDQILSQCHLVIAHNARFDRPFVEKKSKSSKDRVWACSVKQIGWGEKGYSSKLELLNIYHGFFTESHRALNDAEALLYLLSHADEQSKAPYLAELIVNARRPMTQVIASGAPFESKDLLKRRAYSWDNLNRFWSKTLYKDELEIEMKWLEESVYCGPFGGLTRDLPLSENFR